MTTPGSEWWRTAVIYQVYPRSYADADGDGIGDLPGALARIDHLADLGVDAVWFSPFMPSPQKDAGYDVSDYRDIDPMFGTLADFDAFLAAAHERGIRVIVDLVPNHSSDQHAWFQEALAAGPGSAARGRYVFAKGKGRGGAQPPNNWPSFFGGPAWTRLPDGEWYLHLFDSSQPDFNWDNPEVREEFRDILRFWLDRGVDGFRVDVAHGLVKDAALPDRVVDTSGQMGGLGNEAPYLAQPGVHDIYRDWRALLDTYDGDRALCAEAWLPTLEQVALWVRPDEMHQAFNMNYLGTPWDAERLRHVIDESRTVFGAVGAPPTWVLSNHDVIRHPSRLALPEEEQSEGIGPASKVLPDPVVALRRGRAATALMLALPGSAYLFQGEELGLPEVVEIPDAARQDPRFIRTAGAEYGRDGCRVPMPWTAGGPAFGFNDTGASWLPQPDGWGAHSRDAQAGDPASTLSLYRALLRLRRAHGLGSGDLEWETDEGDVLAFRNGDVRVVANLGADPVPLPPGEVLVRSGGRAADPLGTDETAWIRV
ncbi:glycoside hydrolase family 13 protein [Microbacterium excoecariae]|uniref:glycoside hydrolase family 13 protein n=1 Tax=Microbacterium excoecariae TaxID=2715210 RepID=UPI001408C1C5|nr:glycoside hydrolase family 13 protein [Microbacterium excoecariae]NHI17823.1 glycoside hydrolase family 13 protein [Microbacterium excoecariae]